MILIKKLIIFTLILSLGIIVGIFAHKIISSPQTTLEVINSPLSQTSQKQIIGFMPYWLLTSSEDSYKPYLTNLTYFGLTLNPDGTIQKKVNLQEEEPGWTTLTLEKYNNKFSQAKKDKLKTSLLLHLSNEEDITTLLQDPVSSAKNTLSEVTPIMKEHGFNDLNLDIESFVNATSSSQIAFLNYVREIKKGLEENKLGSLTVETTPSSFYRMRLIDNKSLGEIADFVVLMAYDYHYRNSFLSGPVAPLGGAGKISEMDVESSIVLAASIIPPHKLILGIPLYGYEWETLDEQPNIPNIPDSGKTASSKRVSELLKECTNCIRGVDEYGLSPYIIIPEDGYVRQIFYENEDSVQKKIDLVKKYKLGGVALWALGYEDETILNPLKTYK